MFIYNGFPSRRAAEEFAEATGGTVYDSQEESDKHDPFPWVLTPPIVLVPRYDPGGPDDNEPDATPFGGVFAGT